MQAPGGQAGQARRQAGWVRAVSGQCPAQHCGSTLAVACSLLPAQLEPSFHQLCSLSSQTHPPTHIHNHSYRPRTPSARFTLLSAPDAATPPRPHRCPQLPVKRRQLCPTYASPAPALPLDLPTHADTPRPSSFASTDSSSSVVVVRYQAANGSRAGWKRRVSSAEHTRAQSRLAEAG